MGFFVISGEHFRRCEAKLDLALVKSITACTDNTEQICSPNSTAIREDIVAGFSDLKLFYDVHHGCPHIVSARIMPAWIETEKKNALPAATAIVLMLNLKP